MKKILLSLTAILAINISFAQEIKPNSPTNGSEELKKSTINIEELQEKVADTISSKVDVKSPETLAEEAKLEEKLKKEEKKKAKELIKAEKLKKKNDNLAKVINTKESKIVKMKAKLTKAQDKLKSSKQKLSDLKIKKKELKIEELKVLIKKSEVKLAKLKR